MIRVLIGHRGSGKTSLLSRIETYFRDRAEPIMTHDLDKLIEREMGKTIEAIFSQEGEKNFREREQKCFREFVNRYRSEKCPVFLSVGAGFEIEPVRDCEYVWVRRVTDHLGRVFFDRPRLNANVSPIEEYLERFKKREQAYSAHAHWIWTVLEGWDQPNRWERDFFLANFSGTAKAEKGKLDLPVTLTVLPSNVTVSWLASRLDWSGLRFELRDDLLNREEWDLAWKEIPQDRLLVSFRKNRPSHEMIDRISHSRAEWDWAIELGDFREFHSTAQPSWISLHLRRAGETVPEAIHRLSAQRDALNPGARLKLAVEISNFRELEEGHRWALEDPKHRSFLPRSESGKWNWYRVLNLPKSPLSFVREGNGSSLDQPDLAQVLQRGVVVHSVWFAAVLGDPVLHSRTPAEQFKFFLERRMPVYAIPIAPDEWDMALSVLLEMGLRAAAVTAPLKILAGENRAAINTLLWSDSKNSWIRDNTDEIGLEELLRGHSSDNAAVWGGGGTLEVIRKKLPLARFYSARLGCDSEKNPDTVIWAVGSTHRKKIQLPPDRWRPKTVIDLNYTEDSPGREYALKIGATYISGIEMFKAQAFAQREFWSQLDEC